VAGIQVLIWAGSGLYMTLFDINVIRGEHLLKEMPPAELAAKAIKPIAPELIAEHAPIQSITLKRYFGQLVYEIRKKRTKIIIDAYTGEIKTSIAEEAVRTQADTIYAGKATIASIKKLDRYPGEIGGRKQPVWQVEYNDWLHSTLYFHDTSGQLVSKRTDLWRVFDLLWILHIMDFLRSDGHTGYLFRFFSIASFLMALFGTWLLYFRLKGVDS
jgi:hypothetical protein